MIDERGGGVQKELRILYEDKEILVCVKPAGVPVQSDRSGDYALTDQVLNYLAVSRTLEVASGISKSAGTSESAGSSGTVGSSETTGRHFQIPYLAVIHRLDRPVGGVLVFAKTKQAAAELSRQVREHEMRKRYYCVLTGCRQMTPKAAEVSEEPGKPGEPGIAEIPEVAEVPGILGIPKESKEDSGWQELTDYIVTDKRTNLSRLAGAREPGAKRAALRFRFLEYKSISSKEMENPLRLSEVSEVSLQETYMLAEVELLTGRHHQIRVQMTRMSDGLWGDTKYNPDFTGKKGWFELALFSHELILTHPSTGRKLRFEALPEGELFDRFSYIQRLRER